jgi:hypothetical protein
MAAILFGWGRTSAGLILGQSYSLKSNLVAKIQKVASLEPLLSGQREEFWGVRIISEQGGV